MPRSQISLLKTEVRDYDTSACASADKGERANVLPESVSLPDRSRCVAQAAVAGR